MVILCPNCKKRAYMGAIFCEECGSRLDMKPGGSTQSITSTTPEVASFSPTPLTRPPSTPVEGVEGVIVLQLLETNQVFPLKGKQEYILGRVSEDHSVRPDVDLSQCKAFEHGVSRLHAKICWEGKRVLIIDLGSSNGTRLNGQPLSPNLPQALTNGDVISLGKLKIRAIIRT